MSIPSRDRTVPSDFVWRRLHSLTGFFLVLFLILHIITNSQAALFVGDDGHGFIQGANALEGLPFLPLLELLLLGVPIIIHTVWGIKYLRTAKFNSFKSDGSVPELPEYPRNHAYTWQRITSWILVFGILAHVIHMRFLERPIETQRGHEKFFIYPVNKDEGLATLAARLDVKIYDQNQIHLQKRDTSLQINRLNEKGALEAQENNQKKEWIQALDKRPLGAGDVLTVSKDFGTAELMMLRETFKSPIMIGLYTLLVLSTTFHAFNGLWTFLITWGITLTPRSQQLMRTLTTTFMIVITFLGLAAVWGTYWINLKS